MIEFLSFSTTFGKLCSLYKAMSCFFPQLISLRLMVLVVDRCVGSYLRRMCEDHPKDWFFWLSLAKCWYNTSFHTAIKLTPYEII